MKRALLGVVLGLAFFARGADDVPEACKAVANWKPAGDAVATDADRKEFANSSECSDWIYRIVGDEFNPVKARRCCLATDDCNGDLAIIFANGWGVRRDYDAAKYFICRASATDEFIAPAEQEHMLEHIEKMRTGATKDELTYCDNVTSGRGQFFCAQLEMARQSEREAPRVEAVKKVATPGAKPKLEALLNAAQKFAEEEGGYEGEDSRGGTGYPAMVVDAERETYSAFVVSLEQYSKKRAPQTTAADASVADKLLNAHYKQLMMKMGACPTCADDGGEEGRKELRKARRAWIRYRDAWAAYYAARWSGTAPADVLEREIRTVLTKKRVAQFRHPS